MSDDTQAKGIEYVQIHHKFPDDQLAFVNAYVNDKDSALRTRF